MSAELHVHSDRPPVAWESFTQTHPLGSIALDGYVSGPTRYQAVGPYQNFNHHEGVDRLSTGSTAQQVLRAVRMGLDKAFQREGQFGADVFVNDCDEDVCASWYLLENISQAKTVTNPALNRFVEVAGTLDVTAGAFPYDKDMELLGELAWVFEPYTLFRASGEMARKDNNQYRSVIQDVGHRIGRHLLGRGERVPLDLRYRTVGGGSGWAMIESVGKDGRIGALRDGIDAYVIAQQTGEARWRYTLGRRSVYIPFELPELYQLLNQAEPNRTDDWGGSDTIGGSPRTSGSQLSPERVTEIVNAASVK